MTEVRETLDIAANRRARKWSRRALAGRLAWETVGVLLFRIAPRPFWAWRRGVLRLFGARIGRAVHIHPTVRITIPWTLTVGDEVGIGDRVVLYSLGPITIGARATISQHVHLCAGSHDFRRPDMPLLKPPIAVGEEAWLCADAFIGPGVTVGRGAVVGARAVVVRDVAERTVVAGNPARPIGVR
ncbi:colanic acid biosynthesis acetyltransferase WcaF [Prosthecomicrobium pneumaticum]|uniref:Putative colanic acid biosynthesis acetyltransferase WcaF n=1 Tax=Prosthecomicrobium pneumaticum TaxID=81895 RepID=A0A7W9CTZ6_9HYPH|nr:putative colanic acid biosynthesis acetyltransferase WcaF [Prosthecomicrobium pneumaticum]